MSRTINQLTRKIDRIKRDLQNLGPMRPGSISRQYRDPRAKKGAFYQISYTHRMKSHTEHLKAENLAAIRREIANFKQFKRLMAEWVDCALELSKLKIKQAGAK